MTEAERLFLLDTAAILVNYDGFGDSAEHLRGLIDEARERINAVLTGTTEEYTQRLMEE